MLINLDMLATQEIHPSLISGSTIDGVQCIQLKMNIDPRGSFTEVFRDSWETCLEPVQWSVVQSEAHAFRGMHFHKRHDEYFCLINGESYVGLKDLRPESPTYMASAIYHFTSQSLRALVFPKEILHGWFFTTPSIHLQAVSESYSDYGHDDNHGCRWDDPALNFDWPFDQVMLSERAKTFGSFQDLLDTINI